MLALLNVKRKAFKRPSAFNFFLHPYNLGDLLAFSSRRDEVQSGLCFISRSKLACACAVGVKLYPNRPVQMRDFLEFATGHACFVDTTHLFLLYISFEGKHI